MHSAPKDERRKEGVHMCTATIADLAISERLEKIGVSLNKGADLGSSLKELEDAVAARDSVKKVKIIFHLPSCRVLVGKLNVSPDIMISQASEFVENNGTSTNMVCFPTFIKKAKDIVSSLRHLKENISIGSSDYMDLESYENDFLPKYVETREQLDQLKGLLSTEYEELLQEFTDGVHKLLDVIAVSDSDLKRIDKSLARITGKPMNEFMDAVSIELVSDFDADQISNEELKEVASEAHKMRVASLLEELILGNMQDSFEAVCSFYKNVKTSQKAMDRHPERERTLDNCKQSKKTARRQAEVLRRSNVGGSAVLTALQEQFEKMERCSTVDDALEHAYAVMVDIIGCSTEMGFEIKTKSLPDYFSVDDILNEYAERKAYGEAFF